MFGIRFGCLACSTKRECQICSLVLRARHVEWITRLQFYDINLLEHLRKVFRTFFFLFVPAQTFVQTEYMLLYLGDGRSCLFIVMNAAGSRGRVVIFNFITHIWVPAAAAPKWTPFISVSNLLGGHCELQCVWQRYILMWPSSRISLYMPMADPTVTHEINAIQRKRRALLATDVSMWLVFVSVWDGDVEYQFNVASTTSWINAIHSRTTTARKPIDSICIFNTSILFIDSSFAFNYIGLNVGRPRPSRHCPVSVRQCRRRALNYVTFPTGAHINLWMSQMRVYLLPISRDFPFNLSPVTLFRTDRGWF